MSDKKREARFTLTGKNMPKHVYDILEQKSKERSITNYIVSLIEKEQLMDQLLPSLALMGGMHAMLQDIHSGSIQVAVTKAVDEPETEVVEEVKEQEKPKLEEVIPEGDINISTTISGGFEDDGDYDF